ncbi:MAG: hypothetical protein CL969_06500 [Euryarchaeota archaeon]|jgi:hypothetical protein|nr:hypothetical protein [Euryarchaeota archaeon]MDP6575745.1 hypothetical protein [Candidatus Peribacteraceae bacterium]|tara:strand:+ start:3003 stop:4697 length:1695 start_codon:yes stop_codon:yes gene_type:complete
MPSSTTLHSSRYDSSFSDDATKEDVIDEDELGKDIKCEKLKRNCLDHVASVMAGSPLYTKKDFELEERGLSMFESEGKVEELEKSISKLPGIEQRLSRAEFDFRRQVSEAQSKGYLTPATANYWLKKMYSSKIHWSDKERFIYGKFPSLVKNWAKMNKDIKKIKDEAKKDETLKQVPEVKKILTGDGLKGYKEWRNAVDLALGAFEAHKRGNTALYKEAKNILDWAAKSQNVLSENKIGTWMHRIFKSSTSNENIRKFVQGSDSKSLRGMIGRWTDVKTKYDNIENKRNKNGTPRAFHFVTTNKFLEWHYTKRLAYVNEANQRFADFAKEKPIFLDIRRELDMEDWDSAQVLIEKAEGMDLNTDDQNKLKSLRWYLREHRTEEVGIKSEKNDEIEHPGLELNRLLSLVPTSLQALYRNSIKADKWDCLKALMYNRVWCHEKGRVLDENREAEMEERASEVTKNRIDHGDQGDHTLCNVDQFQDPSIRGYAHTGINKSQILFASPIGYDSIISRMKQEDCWRFRYWTTLIPKGISFGTHAYVVKKLNHQISSVIRKMSSDDYKWN